MPPERLDMPWERPDMSRECLFISQTVRFRLPGADGGVPGARCRAFGADDSVSAGALGTPGLAPGTASRDPGTVGRALGTLGCTPAPSRSSRTRRPLLTK